MNGDGYHDIIVREGNLDTAKSDASASYFQDVVWILDGSKLFGPDAGDMEPEDAILLDFYYEEDLARTGSSLHSADFDGDGVTDFSIGAQMFPTADSSGNLYYSGKVYVYVSGINGW
jgi:hypothetical protein